MNCVLFLLVLCKTMSIPRLLQSVWNHIPHMASYLHNEYSWFHVTSCDHKIPLNTRYHFDSRNRYSSVTLVKLSFFWLSSHNFGEVAMIQKFQYFITEFCMGWPCWMTWHVLILEILTFLNYSYFAKTMSGKPKISSFTKVTKLYLFLESKKWYLLLKGILWSQDL